MQSRVIPLYYKLSGRWSKFYVINEKCSFLNVYIRFCSLPSSHMPTL